MISRDSSVVEQVRRFDRFYEPILRKAVRAAANEDFSAADVRVLNELGWVDGGGSGAWLSYRLDLDPARTCRVLKKLEAFSLVAPSDSTIDARMRNWCLTPLGRQFAESIEAEYRDRVTRMLFDVMPADHARLAEAMSVIEEVLHRAWVSATS